MELKDFFILEIQTKKNFLKIDLIIIGNYLKKILKSLNIEEVGR